MSSSRHVRTFHIPRSYIHIPTAIRMKAMGLYASQQLVFNYQFTRCYNRIYHDLGHYLNSWHFTTSMLVGTSRFRQYSQEYNIKASHFYQSMDRSIYEKLLSAQLFEVSMTVIKPSVRFPFRSCS